MICFCVSNVKAIQLADSSNGERKEYYLSFLFYFCVFSDQLACNVSGISHQTNARCVPVSVPTPGPRPRKRGQEGMVVVWSESISNQIFRPTLYRIRQWFLGQPVLSLRKIG